MEASTGNNIKIIKSAHPEDISLVADYSQVEQVLINLIKNAVAAISDKKNGVIELKAFKAEGATIIRVDDNGAGISRPIIEDIFVPFFTTRQDGSGIGLSLSRQIMQNHKGSISVDSAPGKGSKFTLKFYF
jgi:signal transduction histidine kinase